MKVRTAFTFDEPTLRTIRAAHGRGGKASRKECITFIDRAVQDALARAPEPRRARQKRVPAPVPAAPAGPVLSDEERAMVNRDKIQKMYGRPVGVTRAVGRID